MKKLRPIISIMLVIAVMITTLGFTTASVGATSADGYMAKNIYVYPDLSETSRHFTTFSVDFMSENDPQGTYWALNGWDLDLSEVQDEYPNAKGGSAYAGLQHTKTNRQAIMSFWDIYYGENGENKVTPSRVYPSGSEESFGGEGEGHNYKPYYNWQANQWYRMVIHFWEDETTGRTFVGQWVCDLSCNNWTLLSYFNTHLSKTNMTGSLYKFMENYLAEYSNYKRDFQMKNMYAFDSVYNKWVSLDTAKVTYDLPSLGYKTYETHEFGITDNYFYGKTGEPVADQAAYDAAMPTALKDSITQPATPSFGEFDIYEFILTRRYVYWHLATQTTPQQSYQIDIYNEATGEHIKSYKSNRPETTTCYFDEVLQTANTVSEFQ